MAYLQLESRDESFTTSTLIIFSSSLISGACKTPRVGITLGLLLVYRVGAHVGAQPKTLIPQ